MMSEQMPEWVEKHGDEVLRVARSNAVTLVALVALIQKRLAVLELGLCQGKYIDVQPDRLVLGDELRSFFLAPPPLLPGGAVFSIPLGEPRALAMIATGGPVDQYDVDLGASFMLDACVAQKDFGSAERVWRSMLSRFPYNPTVLTSGLVALELEPGFPRLDAVLTAWEEAIPADPTLIEQAQFVATQHPAHPDVAARLTRAVALAKPG
jgi:pentatricopeptide repeat protein